MCHSLSQSCTWRTLGVYRCKLGRSHLHPSSSLRYTECIRRLSNPHQRSWRSYYRQLLALDYRYRLYPIRPLPCTSPDYTPCISCHRQVSTDGTLSHLRLRLRGRHSYSSCPLSRKSSHYRTTRRLSNCKLGTRHRNRQNSPGI